MRKKKILVAMSGGVDSSVAAAILKEQGHDVGGATIRAWNPVNCPPSQNPASCCGLSGLKDARDVAERLGIPYWAFNFEKDFKRLVIDPFAEEYQKGRTPNPCIVCNEHIKSRLFLAKAQELGYEAVATGHYAQVGYEEVRKSFYLAEGRDASKDQSYVLFPLTQDFLSRFLLPLGDFTKDQIRQKAKELGLKVWDKPDSQEICFVPNDDYGDFLKREYFGGETRPGVIRTRDGKVLGEHPGYFYYTRGQRRGLNVAHSERLYVLETDPIKNEVIVGTKEDVFGKECLVDRINWFLKPEARVFQAGVKIRHQHPKTPATLTILESEKVSVVFEDLQDAITPGQAAVFYDGPRVLGGGWIEKVGGR